MTNHKLNMQIEAEVMLRVPCDQWGIAHHGSIGHGPTWIKIDGSYVPGEVGNHERCYPRNHPCDYSGSPDAAWHMEEEIERRPGFYRYVVALMKVLNIAYPLRLPDHCKPRAFWKFAHATPEQRCLAALEAVRGGSNDSTRP